MKTATRAFAPLVLAALTLGGCISLLPKTKPSQLYSFGVAAPASAPSPAAGRFAVRLAPIGFPVPAAADRILTRNGDQAAYVSGGRWLTSAANLFETAVVQTFDTRSGAARLLARGELAPAAYILKLDVRRFETRYDQDAAAAPPTVVVEVYAALDNPADASRDRERIFVAKASPPPTIDWARSSEPTTKCRWPRCARIWSIGSTLGAAERRRADLSGGAVATCATPLRIERRKAATQLRKKYRTAHGPQARPRQSSPKVADDRREPRFLDSFRGFRGREPAGLALAPVRATPPSVRLTASGKYRHPADHRSRPI